MLPESDDHVESEHCLKNRLKILVDSETHWNLKGVHLENGEVFVGSWMPNGKLNCIFLGVIAKGTSRETF
jgi:hypothetical protein